ncbi:uncharacterized protein N7500_008597 [Penicillium coprophilum]|uniref:uncharacterized protein n=1 Tax=Penicillium coprophilum TaxID=36646 RepID=UPI0023A164DC|nr:uncharacterized protein N7500_008597 [Penicillium coprophilum]KAJ5158946.1 hypothetical protein N7500_008597 [Penicillium coprophilum]
MSFQPNPRPIFTGYRHPRLYTELTLGTGRVIPTEYQPPHPDDTPQSLFPHCPKVTATERVHRFIRVTPNNRSVETDFLIYTDGACFDNGRINAKAGCSFVFNGSTSGFARFALEYKGPTNQQHTRTNNRAELRAVIGALRYRDWAAEGFTRLVIACDSEYVVEGITSWIWDWLRWNWITTAGEPVRNRDLWECLLGEVEMWHDRGLTVQFWRIPRELNTKADRHAKSAALMEGHVLFTDIPDISLNPV